MADCRSPFDIGLQQIVIQAQQHPQGSLPRRKALSQLIDTIWRSHRLCRPYRGQFTSNYEDIYEEAVQNLFLYICNGDNINNYNPEISEVMTWVNMLLTRRFFREAIPKIIGTGREIKLENAQLENLETPDTVSTFDQIRQFIEDDSEEIFIKEHIKGHPHANFKSISLKRYSGITWEEISTDFGIKIPTLSTFYQRCVQKFAPHFREYL